MALLMLRVNNNAIPAMIGAKGGDSNGKIAVVGDPTGAAEEAPAAPLGTRSLLRKSTAAFNRAKIIKREWGKTSECS